MKKAPKRRAPGGSAELRATYAAAKRDGIWILEWTGGLAAAGPMWKIERLEGQLRRDIDVTKLRLGEILQRNLGEVAGGETREEACRDAVEACRKAYRSHPDRPIR